MTEQYYIKNAKLVLEHGIIWDGAVLTRGERIAACGRAGDIPVPDGAKVIDAEGLYVGPGLVDIHVHGCGRHFFYEEPEAVTRHFLSHGETTILPTLYYDLSKEAMLDAVKRLKAYAGSGGAAEAVGGLYMECPYMNPKYGACAEKNQWRGPIRPEDYREIVDCAGEMARVWVVAPEREGLEPFLAYARAVNPGTVFSVGHSEATPEQIFRLKRYGIRMQTHSMNATGRVGGQSGVRGCGPDEACLLDPEMYAELICDSRGVHVMPEMQRLLLRGKGLDRVILITDSFPGEASAEAEDLIFDSAGRLNGSAMTMDAACRNIMRHTNCGIAQAFLLASRNPARAVGLGSEIGTVEAGKRANLVFVDDMFHVGAVMLKGGIWRQ